MFSTMMPFKFDNGLHIAHHAFSSYGPLFMKENDVRSLIQIFFLSEFYETWYHCLVP